MMDLHSVQPKVGLRLRHAAWVLSYPSHAAQRERWPCTEIDFSPAP